MAYGRRLQPGQQSVVMIGVVDGSAPVEVFWTDEMVVEAPNWTMDGEWLIVNAVGRLWRLPVMGDGALAPIELDLPALNNDHVLDPDGEHVFVSAADGHLYRAPLDGGSARRVTNEVRPDGLIHYLHGVSPDGSTLASIGVRRTGTGTQANVYTVPATGGADVQLTYGDAPADGSEYSPGGEWIYLNTEAFSELPGHAQIARMRLDGPEVEQLTFDEQVNWFPHWAPDGSTAVYLSFASGTVGHPADRPVRLELVRDAQDPASWRHPQTLVRTFGGQGTINVNSWAPDSGRFGYVSYPVESESA